MAAEFRRIRQDRGRFRELHPVSADVYLAGSGRDVYNGGVEWGRVGRSGEADHPSLQWNGMPEASSGQQGNVSFLGSFLHQLDEKGRVSLPAQFRREAGDSRFVLAQPYPPALALYPDSTWSGVQRELMLVRRNSAEARRWVVRIAATAVEVTPDSQGRILIPSRLQESARLDGEIRMVGALDHVQLWNPDLLEESVKDEDGGFEELARQVFP